MDRISYFKLQAKNLMRDFKTKKMEEGDEFYSYSPQFFKDIDDLIVDWDIDEDHFTLMQAQHMIAYFAGFEKWSDLLHASEEALELGELLFKHRDEWYGLREDWDMYLAINNMQNLSDAAKLQIFKAVYLEEFD